MRPASVVLIAITAVVVAAAGCSKKQAQPITFAKNSAMPVSLSLLKAEGQTGRSGPITSNYRPQVKFSSAPDDLTCLVTLPSSAATLEPGQTLDVSLSCDSEVKVEVSRRGFVMFEGGKQVGQGTVRLP